MITVQTDHPIATDSLDHLHPHGTANDNSVWPQFNVKAFQKWPNVRLLDIGCAGGGLVKSIIDDGGFAVGVEGSDYSRNHMRAEWCTIPGNLFTADATRPFTVCQNDKPIKFDIVTAWEFFEHIPAPRLPQVFANIHRHLSPAGVFIGSVCTISAGLSEDGTEHHVTIRSAPWWRKQFIQNGFVEDVGLRDYFSPDWVRGENTGVAGSICSCWRPAA